MNFLNSPITSSLLAKIIPLYLVILLGYIAGKKLHIDHKTIANLLMYIVSPAVFFYSTCSVEISLVSLSLPLIFFLVSTVIAFSFYFIGKYFFQDATRNILAFTAGNGNTGYFGLTIAILLFNNQTINLYVLCIMGLVLFQNSIGYFLVAKTNYTIEQSFQRMLKLPALSAFVIGLSLNALNFKLEAPLHDLAQSFRGAYSILGMMIIGLGLSRIQKLSFDWSFISLSFIAKFICWPLLVYFIIFLDQIFLKSFSQDLQKAMILISIVPLAADTVTFATALDAKPEKAALAVLLSTLFALFYIPFMLS